MMIQTMLRSYSVGAVGVLTFVCLLLVPWVVSGRMSSSNYAIERDVVASGGQENATSTSYELSDTAGGQVAIGRSSGTLYALSSVGYRQQEAYSMSIDCGNRQVVIDGVQLTGKSDLEDAWIACQVHSDDPSGYVLGWMAQTEDLINQADGNYSIGPLVHTTPAAWPDALASGSAWGARVATFSAHYDAATWGTTNDYEDTSYWSSVPAGSVFNAAYANTATPSAGDTHWVYLAYEIDERTVLPAGAYTNEMYLSVMPSF